MTTTPANLRQSRSRAKRIAAGGKDIRVLLTPAAAAKLDSFIARGWRATDAINRVLARSRPDKHPCEAKGQSAPQPGRSSAQATGE